MPVRLLIYARAVRKPPLRRRQKIGEAFLKPDVVKHRVDIFQFVFQDIPVPFRLKLDRPGKRFYGLIGLIVLRVKDAQVEMVIRRSSAERDQFFMRRDRFIGYWFVFY